jgi:hypothetical protein
MIPAVSPPGRGSANGRGAFTAYTDCSVHGLLVAAPHLTALDNQPSMRVQIHPNPENTINTTPPTSKSLAAAI